jgi:prepilin signal peptidase PulO-like enzyme (type II secretory pathway)
MLFQKVQRFIMYVPEEGWISHTKRTYVFAFINLNLQLAALFSIVHSNANGIEAANQITLLVLLFYIAWIDWKKRIIPNQLLFVLLLVKGVSFLLQLFLYDNIHKSDAVFQLLYTLCGFCLLAFLSFATHRGFGLGDVKLLTIMTLFLSFSFLLSVLLVGLLAALVVALYLLLVKKGSRKDTIPFGPFLYIGLLINWLLV